MRYVCVIWFDPSAVFNGSPEGNAVLDEVRSYSEGLRDSGHLLFAQSLAMPSEAMTVRVRDRKMSATDGPFMETKEMLAGFVVIEARDMNEALEIASRNPFARLGAIEVRPTPDFSKPRPQL